jgi:hypothetical protein
MRCRATSIAVAGAALVAALALAPSPASAAPREPERQQVRTFAGWLGGAWTRAVEAVSWIVDPNGATADGAGEPAPQPAGDISLMIDPDG